VKQAKGLKASAAKSASQPRLPLAPANHRCVVTLAHYLRGDFGGGLRPKTVDTYTKELRRFLIHAGLEGVRTLVSAVRDITKIKEFLELKKKRSNKV
jgi:hypothetical protein